jgi:hypothetical protein
MVQYQDDNDWVESSEDQDNLVERRVTLSIRTGSAKAVKITTERSLFAVPSSS